MTFNIDRIFQFALTLHQQTFDLAVKASLENSVQTQYYYHHTKPNGDWNHRFDSYCLECLLEEKLKEQQSTQLVSQHQSTESITKQPCRQS